MEELNDYKFGRVYTKEIKPEDAKRFATIFGEGSSSLTNLIEYCINNKIITRASCKGHPENVNLLERPFETGYLTFQFDNNYAESDFVYYIASIPLTKKGITVEIDSMIDSDRTITVRVPASSKGLSEEYFEYVLDYLKKYNKLKEENTDININQDIKQIVDTSFADYSSIIYTISYNKYSKIDSTAAKTISRCPSSNKTNILHQMFGKELSNIKNVDKMINTERKRKVS